MIAVDIGRTRVECVAGDIAAQETDAVVNAANNELWMGSGVAGAIKRAGGSEIEEEAMRRAPIPVGEAIVTGGGRLRARWVVHAAAMSGGGLPNALSIRAATANAIRRAGENGMRSIAFPAIGTGVGGFPIDECARIMVGAVVEGIAANAETSLEVVRFVLRGDVAFLTFAAEIEKLRTT